MISFRQLFKEVNREKWSLALMMFGIILLWYGLDYLAYFLNFHFLNLGNLDLSGLDSGFKGVIFFFLLSQQERVWRLNRYRLLPVSEARLYAANLLGTIGMFLLSFMIEFANIGLSALVLPSTKIELSAGEGLSTLEFFYIYLFALVLVPTIISFMNFSSRAFLAALPERFGRGGSTFVVVLTVIVVLIVIGLLTGGVFTMMPGDDATARKYWMLAGAPLLMVVLFVAFTVGNLALLKGAIETRK